VRLHQAEQRVELVDAPAGPEQRIELRNARTVAERGFAAVAAAGVDAGQADGLVTGAWAQNPPALAPAADAAAREGTLQRLTRAA